MVSSKKALIYKLTELEKRLQKMQLKIPNPGAVGSNPAGGTKYIKYSHFIYCSAVKAAKHNAPLSLGIL